MKLLSISSKLIRPARFDRWTDVRVAMLGLLGITTGAAQAQTTYDWTMQDDIASWGDGAFALSGGSYTRSFQINSSFADQGYSGSWYGSGNEGPYDGRSGNIYTQNSYGSYTRTDPNAIFDLTTVGSSATIRTVLNLFGPGWEAGVAPVLKGHALQFGLSNSPNFIGSAGTDALFMALDIRSANGGPTGSRWLDYDLNLYDETSDSNPTDGIWGWTPLVNLTGAADNMRAWASNVPGETGVWHAFELKYTNVGNNTLQLDLGVMQLTVSGRYSTDVLQDSALFYQTTQNVDLATSSLDLSALRPAFGFNTNDAIDTANAIGSGVNLDWENAYPTGFSTPVPVPEPTGLALVATAGLMANRRRRAGSSATH